MPPPSEKTIPPISGRDLRNELGCEIVYRPVDVLKSDLKSPRAHTPRHVQQLASSIKEFGFLVPVLVDASDTIIAGHARVLAAKRLGCREVPTIAVSHLTGAQLRAYQIADNRLAEISTWDDRLLAEALQGLSILDLDFSLDITGFELPDIDLRIQGLSPVMSAAVDPADTVPAPTGAPVVTRPGDLWVLGQHRVLCASALEAASYAILMEGRQAGMVFTDPPYNVKIEGNVSGLGAVQHRDFAMGVGEMSEAEFTAFLKQALGHAAQHSKDGSLHFVCMDWRHLAEVMAAGGQVYTEMKNLCVWAKDNAGMGSLYRSQHELILVYKHGKGRHRNNIELGRHGRNRSNVWRYPGVNSFNRTTEEGNLLALHPTVKPVALVADAILDCTVRRDIVLDLFLGSGSTLMAAERVGRRCYGTELDPVYVDTIIRRWQAVTGEQARRASDNVTFEACAHQGGDATDLATGEAQPSIQLGDVA